MADATAELERKRIEVNQRADEHRAHRDRLNGEARALADQRSQVLDELHRQSAEAQEHRHHRDLLNEQVRTEKKLREEANRRLQEAGDRLQELKRNRPPRQGAVPIWRLRKELKELEFRHMTTALTGEQEKRLIEEMKRIEVAIRDQDEQLRKDPDIEAALQTMESTRREAEEHHQAVGRLAEEAQRAHDAMVALYETVDDLRRQADDVQARLIATKTQADEEHRAHIGAIEEVRDIEKMLYAARGPRGPGAWEEAEPPKEEDFLARLKKGEKGSTQDLLELQKSGGRP